MDLRGGGCQCTMSPAKGAANLVCHFLLPTCYTPPLLTGDMRVVAGCGGTLVVPTAHTCPGTRLVCVAWGIRAWRALGAGGWGPLEAGSAPQHRPQQVTKGNAGRSRVSQSRRTYTGHLPHPRVGPAPCPVSLCVCWSERASEREIPNPPVLPLKSEHLQNRKPRSSSHPSPASLPSFFLPPATRARF